MPVTQHSLPAVRTKKSSDIAKCPQGTKTSLVEKLLIQMMHSPPAELCPQLLFLFLMGCLDTVQHMTWSTSHILLWWPVSSGSPSWTECKAVPGQLFLTGAAQILSLGRTWHLLPSQPQNGNAQPLSSLLTLRAAAHRSLPCVFQSRIRYASTRSP